MFSRWGRGIAVSWAGHKLEAVHFFEVGCVSPVEVWGVELLEIDSRFNYLLGV